MIKFIAIFCFVALGLFAAQRLNEKSQRKIAIIVGVGFVVLLVSIVIKELFFK